MIKYEYLVRDISTTGDTAEDQLDALGQEGWELVGFENITPHAQRMIFKKPIASDKPFMVGM